MIRLTVNGCTGKMGGEVVSSAIDDERFEVTAGFSRKKGTLEMKGRSIPVYAGISECKETVDVVIDFSAPQSTMELIEKAREREIPVVIATSGLEESHFSAIERCAKDIPVFQAPNMAFGIHMLKDLSLRLSEALGPGYDVEIVEKYHRLKRDAPGGTAAHIASVLKDSRERSNGSGNGGEIEVVYGRHDANSARKRNEIGLHSLRGGSIIGEHEIVFAGAEDVLRITHTALSRSLFAVGALKAAAFVVAQKPGLYHMEDLV